MSALGTAIAPYSTLELTAIMTSALVAALLIIATGFRIIRSLSAVRDYEAACGKVVEIEARLAEMQAYIATLEQQFTRDMDAEKQKHVKECFDLQQLVFTRNSEILSLKNTLIEMSKSGDYSYS